jgi:hypothetical protein
MTNFADLDHPRVSNGTFTEKAQSSPEFRLTAEPEQLSIYQSRKVMKDFRDRKADVSQLMADIEAAESDAAAEHLKVLAKHYVPDAVALTVTTWGSNVARLGAVELPDGTSADLPQSARDRLTETAELLGGWTKLGKYGDQLGRQYEHTFRLRIR